jgi:hypothetical protein
MISGYLRHFAMQNYARALRLAFLALIACNSIKTNSLCRDCSQHDAVSKISLGKIAKLDMIRLLAWGLKHHRGIDIS